MRLSFLWAGGYFVAAVLVITPLIDVTIAALPFRPGDMVWRFAAIGIFAEGVMTALLGLFLALAVAVSLEHRGMVKLMGVVSALAFLAFVGVIGLFLIEAMSMRLIVAEEAQAGFGIASVGALFKHVSGAIGTGIMALAARAEVKKLAAPGGRSGKRHNVLSTEHGKAAAN